MERCIECDAALVTVEGNLLCRCIGKETVNVESFGECIYGIEDYDTYVEDYWKGKSNNKK